MAIGPIDYSAGLTQPLQNALAGYQAGAGIQQFQQAQADADRQRVQQLQMQSDITTVANNPNASAADYARLGTLYPQFSEQFKRSYDVLNAGQQQQALSQMSEVYAALHNEPATAVQLLMDRADAARNSGDQKAADGAAAMAKLVQINPDAARTTVALKLASILGPEKFASTFGDLGKENRAAAAAPGERERTAAETANYQSQITDRAGRLNFDINKALSDYQAKIYELNQKAGQLDDGAKKLINDSTVASVNAEHGAASLNDLAGRLDATGGGYGGLANFSEWMAKQFGNQDALTGLRQEYVRLRATSIGKNLPPGAASDKDIALAMSGYPPETADSKYIASFLRGMAKVQQLEAASESAKAEWVNSVGHLGRPIKDIDVMGVKVPAGSNFTDFSRQFVQRAADRLGKTQAASAALQQVGGRGYMRWAQPEAAAPTAPAGSQPSAVPAPAAIVLPMGD